MNDDIRKCFAEVVIWHEIRGSRINNKVIKQILETYKRINPNCNIQNPYNKFWLF